MSEFKVRIQNLNSAMDSTQQLESVLKQAADSVQSIKRNLRAQVRQRERIDSRLSFAAEQLLTEKQSIRRVVLVGRQAAELYQKNEEHLLNVSASQASQVRSILTGIINKVNSWWQSFMDWIKDLFTPDPVVSTEINSIVFDDEGQYGGNQGSPKSRKGAEQNALYDIVRQYYPDYTDKELEAFMKKLNSEGCGYVAVINTIFAAYEGREKEFEKTFGFPMYGNNGDLNYDRLLVDFYSATDNHKKGLFGSDTIDNKEDISKADKENPSYNYRTDVTGGGSSQDSREYRTHLYLDQKGVNVDIRNNYPLTPKKFPKIANDGYIIVSFHNGNLLNEDGSVYQVIDGGHAMVVTGVTEDGRYIVSSWGKKFYIDPTDTTPIGKGKTPPSLKFSYYQYK